MSTLPDDIARCSGIGSEEEGWWDDCEDCARRLCPTNDPKRANTMTPDPIIVFSCPYRLEMPK